MTGGGPTRKPGAFIVGTGRCGSTLLSDIVGRHPDLLDVSEFLASLNIYAFARPQFGGHTFWKLLSRPRPEFRAAIPPTTAEFAYKLCPDAAFDNNTLPPILRVTLPRMTAECDQLYEALKPAILARPTAPAAQQYRFLFDWLCDALGKRMWVERSGASALGLPAMLHHFPEEKFIHIVRDGRAVASSMAYHPAFRLFATNHLRWQKLGRNYFDLSDLWAGHRTLTALYPLTRLFTNADRDAARTYPLPVFGAIWAMLADRAACCLRNLSPDRRAVMSYEGLVASPRDTVADFCRFLNVAADEAWLDEVAALPQRRASRFESLSDEDKIALDASCRIVLDVFGYPAALDQAGHTVPIHLLS